MVSARSGHIIKPTIVSAAAAATSTERRSQANNDVHINRISQIETTKISEVTHSVRVYRKKERFFRCLTLHKILVYI